MESESLGFTGLKIPRDYYFQMEEHFTAEHDWQQMTV